MSHPNLNIAQQRGKADNLPYAGALTPQEAWQLLQDHHQVKLIDVRTQAEREWVGKVKIAEQQHGAVQWSTWPGGLANPNFIAELSQQANQDQVILFLCRSGVRSRHAAKLATAHGFLHCYDILQGFEGDKNADGHRKTIGGWCAAGLPWLGA